MEYNNKYMYVSPNPLFSRLTSASDIFILGMFLPILF